MSSNILFDCCKGLTSEQNCQGSYSATYRNIVNKTKTKKVNFLNSPKASLKTLSSVRSLKNLENPTAASQIHMVSTTDAANQIQSITVKSSICEKLKYEKPNQKLYLSPTNHKQINEFVKVNSIPQQKYYFSYLDRKSPEHWSWLTPPLSKRQQVSHVSSEGPSQPKMQNNKEQKSKQTLKMNMEKVQKIDKKKNIGIISKRNTLKDSKLNLGQSKFTVISREIEQIHERKPIILEQSTIVLNMFNPTNSQMETWKIQTSTRSPRLTSKQINKQF